MKNKSTIYGLAFLCVILFTQCSLYKTIMNMSRLQFKMAGVSGINIGGIAINNKSSLKDFSILEVAQLTSSISKGNLPTTFVINVQALNPNDGKGGYPRTDATLKSFPFRLLIDGKELFSGNIASPIAVPGTGETTVIPLSIHFDLLQAAQNKTLEGVVHLASSIAGIGNNKAQLELYAKPVVSSFLGDISYPGELKIIDKEFTSK
ncbi:MAG: hypothetical protein LWX56_00895 [Ignavibacteria bacterium]|nr:hypothetical protein [Ignavibacteria bacterium]